MSMMRFLLLLTVSLASFSLVAQDQDFYKKLELSGAQRKQLAQSYREAGNRFIEIGQNERGTYYLSLADEIESVAGDKAEAEIETETETKVNDTEDVSSATDQAEVVEESNEDITFNSQNEMVLEELPFDKEEKLNNNSKYEQDTLAPLPAPKKENLEKGTAVEIDDSAEKKVIVDSVISNYFNGLVTEDWTTINKSTSNMLALNGYEKPLDKASQQKFYEEMFAVYQFNNLTIDKLYNMESKEITVLDGDSNRCIVTIKSNDKAPDELVDWQYWRGFWGKIHYYFIEKLEDKWVIIAFDIDTATSTEPDAVTDAEQGSEAKPDDTSDKEAKDTKSAPVDKDSNTTETNVESTPKDVDKGTNADDSKDKESTTEDTKATPVDKDSKTTETKTDTDTKDVAKDTKSGDTTDKEATTATETKADPDKTTDSNTDETAGTKPDA